jgi:hypothetical protein
MVAVLTTSPVGFSPGKRLPEFWIPLDPFVQYSDVHPDGQIRPPSA